MFALHKGSQMKRGSVALAFVLVFITVGLAKQDKPFEPEYFSVFYYLGSSGQLIELERQTPNQILKGKYTLLAIPGEKSPTRLKAGSKMQFVVRVAEHFDQARTTMQLFHFNLNDGMRQLMLKNEVTAMNKASLKLIAEKYGSSSLKLVPYQDLVPGEYCLSRTTISQGFCFGVDATGTQQNEQ
jgi:hypothetical protein